MQGKERFSLTDFMKDLSEPMPLDKKVALLIRSNAVKVYTFDGGHSPVSQPVALQSDNKKS